MQCRCASTFTHANMCKCHHLQPLSVQGRQSGLNVPLHSPLKVSLSHTHTHTHLCKWFWLLSPRLNVTKAECAGEIPKCVMCSENPIIYQTHRNTHETSPVLVTDWAPGHSGPPSDSKAHSCLSQGSSSLQRFLPNCIIKDKLFLISAFKHAAL